MNDFTKEELEEILIILEHGFGPNIKNLEIVKKIKYMIDNYEHIKPPTMANYVCGECNEEWLKCECKENNDK